MTRPRPSRKARWTIGLSLSAIFSVVALGATTVAFVQVVDALPVADSQDADEPDPDWADSTARAKILDVDVYDVDGLKQPLSFDRRGGVSGYALVDIKFRNNELSADLTRTSIATMSWPGDQDLPEVGDDVKVEYNSYDPEWDVEIFGTGGGDPVAGIDPVVASAPVADPDPANAVTTPVRRTIVVSTLLALLSLIGTVIWARRAAPAERKPVGGQPARGTWPYPQPYPQYPQPQYPQPQYPQQQYPQYRQPPDQVGPPPNWQQSPAAPTPPHVPPTWSTPPR